MVYVVDKKIIIGYGTGRCGTQSLALFLSQQGPVITHEKVSLGWYPVHVTPHELDGFVNREGLVIGDIGYYWVQWIGFLISKHPNVYAINIYRDTEEVIESFWSYKESRASQAAWHPYPFDSRFATKDAIAEAVERYRMYEELARKMYFQQLRRLHIEDLNDQAKLERLLNWMDMPVVDLTPVHVNKSEDFSKERPEGLGRLFRKTRRSKED